MNPPYDGNLHNKIMDCIVSFMEKFECVNLSPIRWIQDPLADYKNGTDWKKFENLRNHIISISVVPTEIANKYFGIGLLQPLGIYLIDEQTHKTIQHNEWYQRILKKIVKDSFYSKHNVCNYSKDLNNYVCLNTMAPPMKYGKPMFDWLKKCGVCTNTNTYEDWKNNEPAATRGDVNNTVCIEFDTFDEALNCYNSMQTMFARYLCKIFTTDIHVHPKFAPFMGEYNHVWTDKMFKDYFEITDDEWDLIILDMKQTNYNGASKF